MKQITFFRNRTVRIFLHIIVWASFFIYPFFYHKMIPIDRLLIIRSLLPLLLLISFFYTNMYVLVPRLLGKKKIALYILIVLAFIAMSVIVEIAAQRFLNPHFYDREIYIHFSFTSALMSALIVWGVSTGLKITGEWYKYQQRKKELENENLAAELAFLKSQVNPHFLFNALNAIYALATKRSDKTADAVMRLSEMMRYLLYDSSESKTALEDELNCLQSFIELQKMRWNGMVEVEYKVDGNVGGKKIAPLLLLPFVENAFKHGISAQRASFISIHIGIEGQELAFSVENSIAVNNNSEKRNSGIGLQNVQRRLQLIYQDNYQLDINKESEKYNIKLNLNLSK